MNNPSIHGAEQAIGYVFADKQLLLTALTHPSYANEHADCQSYQRLECLGDKVLGLIVMEKLYRERSGDEGDLTDVLRMLVSKQPLTVACERVGLGAFIRCGKGASGGEKTLSDVYESVVAAVYLDGGRSQAEKFVERTLLPQIGSLGALAAKTDFKSRLNEYAGKHALGVPEYAWDDKDQALTLRLQGQTYAVLPRDGTQRKQAVEQAAAELALTKLYETR